MVSSEAAPRHGDARLGITGVNKGQNFVQDEILVLHMAQGSIARRDGAVVPAFRIDAIDAEGLHTARIVLIADGPDHAAIFVIVKTSHRSWEYDNRHAC